MNKKHLVWIVIAVFVFNVNSLFNQFIIDDGALFSEANTFYKSLSNVPKIFSKDFLIEGLSEKSEFTDGEVSFSGCVSYRPVTALSFFLDNFLWKNKPFGYRLTNLLLHAGVSLLIYFLSLSLGVGLLTAFFSALVFAAHPIHSELINNVGYRSDFLAAAGFIFALWMYRAYRQNGAIGLLFFSFIGFLMGVFAKETAACLVFFIIASDMLFPFKEEGSARKKYPFGVYALYAGLLIFYLFVYFIVFPNPDHAAILDSRFSWEIFVLIFSPLFHYVSVLFLPHTTTFIPPLHELTVGSIDIEGWVLSAALLAMLSFALQQSKMKKELVVFAFLWWVIIYLPTSNILPLISPLGYRFMYLPSVGFFWLAGALLVKCYDHFSSNVKTERFARYPIILVVILCGTLSMIMNMAYKDNYTNARAMIKYYPESSIPYLLLGHYYFDKNEQLLAVEYYEKYLQLSLLERRANKQQQFVARYQLALSYSSLKNMERAIDGLTDALKHFPKSPEINQHLAYLYDYQGDYPKAVNFALAAISLKPNSPQAYIFAVNGYLELGQKQQAEIYLQNALEYLPSDDPNLQILLRKMNND